VTDNLYSALEEAADRSGRPIQELVSEAVQTWLDDEAMDGAEHDEVELARAEADEQGGVEFEAFFAGILENRD
jgi:hypothetical protein